MRDEATANSRVNWRDIGRFALWTFLIFAANVMAHVAGAAAMWIGFQSNYLLAVLPGVFFLIALIVQPWLLLSATLPVFVGGVSGVLYLPLLFAVSGFTVFVYGTLNRRSKLEGIKRLAGRWRRWRGLAGAMLAGLLTVVFIGYTDAIPQNRGVPRVSSMGHRIQPSERLFQDSRYYIVGAFLDTELVWRARVAPADLKEVIRLLSVDSVSRDALPRSFWRRPQLWWRPSSSGDVRAFSTANFPTDGRGGDGWHACAVYEPQTELLYVWIMDNF